MAKNNSEVTGWVGWIGFATVMLYLLGFMHLVAGFSALLNDQIVILTSQAIVTLDITQWGWVHILGGLLAFVAAGSLMQGKGFGRTVAVLVALVSAVVNMALIPTYPVWSIVIIVVDILIIYAVVVHAGELKD